MEIRFFLSEDLFLSDIEIKRNANGIRGNSVVWGHPLWDVDLRVWGNDPAGKYSLVYFWA